MKILKYIILLVSFLGHAQVSCIVEYDVQLNTLERKGFLKISEKNAPLYYEITEGEVDKNTISEKDGVQLLNRTLNPKKDEKRVQTYNVERDTLFNVDFLDATPVVYYEVVKKIDWLLTNETKIISNYTCVKAKGIFRGRNYIAWFTSEIPVQFGPWKFNNLPGLIIQISDESSNFVWSATKIIFTDGTDNYFLDKNLRSISQREFETEKEIINKTEADAVLLKFLQRGAVLVGSKSTRARELVYDWEK